jgi:hypothetical protein
VSTLTGPLVAALKVAVDSKSTQLWSLLRTVCVDLVELYGDNDIDLGEDVGADRLKMAVIYLLAAIKVSNQRTNLTKNCIDLSADAAFDAPLGEELKRLVADLSSSSATPDPEEIRRIAAAEAEAAAAAAKAPPAKGKPAAKGAAAGAGAAAGTALVPSGRDALYLLCALLRERDPLWADSSEQQLCADLHSLLRTSFPVYSSRCALAESPDPNGPLDVPNGTISTLYIPTKAPAAFAAVLERQPNQLDYSTSGLYSHVSIFFLLGDAKTAAAGAGATPAAPEPGSSREPILTKLVLPRVDVVHVEKTLRDLRDVLLDAEAKLFPTVLRNCQSAFGDCLVQLLGLLKNGIISQPKSFEGESATARGNLYEVVETPPAAPNGLSSYEIQLPVGEAGTVITLKTTGDLLLHFADALCPDKDTELLKDNAVTAFIRVALGYKVSVK